jgi:hypothetical protein
MLLQSSGPTENSGEHSMFYIARSFKRVVEADSRTVLQRSFSHATPICLRRSLRSIEPE